VSIGGPFLSKWVNAFSFPEMSLGINGAPARRPFQPGPAWTGRGRRENLNFF
jgi:hypothetical protein